MFKIDSITFMAALGASHGVFFSVLLWFRKKNETSNKIFALLLLVTSIRIAKNIIVHARLLNPDLPMAYSVWRFLVNFGISHQFAIGPLFVLYFLARTQTNFKFNRRYLWHFVPYLVLTSLSAWIPWAFWRDGGLLFSYTHILCYYLWAFNLYYKAFSLKKRGDTTGNELDLRWLRYLTIISGLLMIAYFPALFRYLGYIVGAIMYAIGIYVVSLIILRDQKVFSTSQKYKSSRLTRHKALHLKKILEQYMQDKAPYLDPGLTLLKLANQLNTTSHELSQVINEQFQQSYAEYINSYRLEAAKEKLTDTAHSHDKIASIAYDCGFNSISLFNTLFKKQTQLTPSQYKAQHTKS